MRGRRGRCARAVRRLARVAGLAALLAVGSCDRSGVPVALERRGGYGSLRDLVLFDRSEQLGGPFFLDRFEATRGDFAQFAATPAGLRAGAVAPRISGDSSGLPIAGIDLRMARAFAAWRHCRLPRSDEWWFACTTDGRDSYPWGSRPDASRANTSDLGVFAPLPVGTFESGRAQHGPYDLIGNVAEWTESVPASWFHDSREPAPRIAAQAVDRSPALSIWGPVPMVFPPLFLVAAAGDRAPREVLGAHFASSLREASDIRAPLDFGDTVGVRLCTTPRELIEAIGDDVLQLEGEDRLQWERFCRRTGHAAVLRPTVAVGAISARARAMWESVLP